MCVLINQMACSFVDGLRPFAGNAMFNENWRTTVLAVCPSHLQMRLTICVPDPVPASHSSAPPTSR